MKRLFVVSDIHGHYTILKQALEEAGFDETNEDHILLCCGDLFDRGNENRMVYEYIQKLERKILVKGNHDERFSKILTQRRVTQADRHNGTVVTLEEFFGLGCVDDNGLLRLIQNHALEEQLQQFISTMVDYYETEHYVFVHGWLPTEIGDDGEQIMEHWHYATDEQWYHARWSKWPDCYEKRLILPQKTIVCGHRFTRYGSRFDLHRAEDDDSIFYGDGMIALDAGTIRSKKINVFVLTEDKLF